MKGSFSKILLMLMLFFVIAEASSSYCSATNPIVEIVSVETGKVTFNAWNSSFYFYKNEVLSVKVIVRNNDNANRTATISVTAYDELDVPFGIYVGNVTLLANETKMIYGSIYVPDWAFSGNGCVTAIAQTLPEGTYCLEMTSYFYLSQGTATYLKLQTFAVVGGFNVSACIDGNSGLAPATVQLDPGLHTLQIQPTSYEWYAGTLYKYTFRCWENGLTSASRAINMPISANQTIIAYYTKKRMGPFQPI